jgi:hypothetical protein
MGISYLCEYISPLYQSVMGEASVRRSKRDLTARIGSAAGFAGDRFDSAGPILDEFQSYEGPRFLIFEVLAERTLAQSVVDRMLGLSEGYSGALERIVAPALQRSLQLGVKVVGNFGAANPRAGARRLKEIVAAVGFPEAKIGIVEGDDILAAMSAADLAACESGSSLLKDEPAIISANAYVGAAGIASALDAGADIVITGRVADASLTLGPLMHVFDWRQDDLDLMAAGTLAGHILECGAQATGGYFADPGCKDVNDLANIGYPIAEVSSDGTFVITKPRNTGGRVDRWTVTEQILYEMHDPAAYLTPDVVLDVRQVKVDAIGEDRVAITGARGHRKPERLKATVCIDAGYLAEAEISYAGPNALGRGMLAIDTIRKRMTVIAPDVLVRTDIIGVSSLFNDNQNMALQNATAGSVCDIRVRFAAQDKKREPLNHLLDEVEALYCVGPAGGAGVRRHMRPRVASVSCLVPRAAAHSTSTIM